MCTWTMIWPWMRGTRGPRSMRRRKMRRTPGPRTCPSQPPLHQFSDIPSSFPPRPRLHRRLAHQRRRRHQQRTAQRKRAARPPRCRGRQRWAEKPRVFVGRLRHSARRKSRDESCPGRDSAPPSLFGSRRRPLPVSALTSRSRLQLQPRRPTTLGTVTTTRLQHQHRSCLRRKWAVQHLALTAGR